MKNCRLQSKRRHGLFKDKNRETIEEIYLIVYTQFLIWRDLSQNVLTPQTSKLILNFFWFYLKSFLMLPTKFSVAFRYEQTCILT